MTSETSRLGVVSATTVVAASMIGAGVYTTSGYTLAALQTPGRVIAAWVVGAAIAICGAISYAVLARRFTESGGEYLFLSRTLHPAAGVTAGIVSMLSGFTGGIAVAAIGFEKYLLPVLSDSPNQWRVASLATASILAAAVLQTVGMKTAARIQNAVVVAKIVMLIGFCVIAWFAFARGEWACSVANSADARAAVVPPLDLLAFAQQLVWISFSFAGFNAAVYLAGEIREPAKNVPRALIAGTLVVSGLYLMLNVIYVYAPGVGLIRGQEEVATIAASAVGGEAFASFVRIVIVVSLFTSVYAMVMAGPRVYAKMAEDGFLPAWFQFNDGRPLVGIWFQAILAIGVVQVATLKSLFGYLGLTLSLCSALTVAMLFRPAVWRACFDRDDGPTNWSWTQVAGLAAAIVYVAATLVLAVLMGVNQPAMTIAAVVTLLAGVVIYPLTAKRRQSA